MHIGNHVRTKRKALGLTQDELAREIGVTDQQVSRIEGGQVVPSLDVLVNLRRKLGVTTDYLLTGQDMTLADPPVSRAAPQFDRQRHLIGVLNELRSTT